MEDVPFKLPRSFKRNQEATVAENELCWKEFIISNISYNNSSLNRYSKFI